MREYKGVAHILEVKRHMLGEGVSLRIRDEWDDEAMPITLTWDDAGSLAAYLLRLVADE